MPRTLLMLEWKAWTDFSQFTLNESPFYQACSHISYTLNFPCQMSLSYVFTTNQLPLGQAHSQVTNHIFAHREQFSPSICSSLTTHTHGWLPQVNQQAKQIFGPKTTHHHSYHSSAWLWREETLNKNTLSTWGQLLLLFCNDSGSLTRFSIFKAFLSMELRKKSLASFHIREKTVFE